MATKNEIILVHIPQDTAMTVFLTDNGLDPYIEKIKNDALSIVPDSKTAKGRAAILKTTTLVRKSRDYLDGVGKELVSKLKEQPKIIDAERKRMRDTLDLLIEDIRKPVTEFEEAEEKRVNRIQEVIDKMKAVPINGTKQQLEDHLARIQNTEISEFFQELKPLATQVKLAVIDQLNVAISEVVRKEAERIELEQLRKEAEERRIEEARLAAVRETEARVRAELANRQIEAPGFVNLPEDLSEPEKGHISEFSGSLGSPEQLSQLPADVQSAMDLQGLTAVGRSNAINDLVALGAPQSYAEWFVTVVYENRIRNIKFTV